MYGTLSLDDLLAATQPTIVEFGEDLVYQGISDILEIHNRLTEEKLNNYVLTSTDRMRRYGGVDSMVMEPIDEVGVPQAQKVTAGATVGFPLRRYANAIQFTRDWMTQHTPEELTVQILAQRDADERTVDREIKRALFRPTNYTFTDRLVQPTSQITIPVKALANADGAPIPSGPNGESFDGSTHTHYLARVGGTVAATDVQAMVNTVIEHHPNGKPMIWISRTDEATFTGIPGFVAFVPVTIHQADTSTYAIGKTLDPTQVNNRAIGMWNGQAEVWVKPWIPAGYFYCWTQGGPIPLVMREPARGIKGLRLLAEFEVYPLRATSIARDFGLGVWNRTNGAILYIGGTSYVNPTIV